MGRYWDGQGLHQADYDRLTEELIPMSGSTGSIEAESLRAASKLGYEFYNNGGGNNVSGALLFLKQHFPGFKNEWWDALAPYVTGQFPSSQEAIQATCEDIVDTVTVYVKSKNGVYTPTELDMLDFGVQETGLEAPVVEDEDDVDEDEFEYRRFGR